LRRNYRIWLENQGYDSGTITAQLHRAGRVQNHYGDLEHHFLSDRLKSVIDALRYTSEDERRGRPNPSKIPFEGKPRTNLASYRNAVENYCRFLSGCDVESDGLEEVISSEVATILADEVIKEDLTQRFGLERDMQTSLRKAIEQLEPGLSIIDNGSERIVDSGRIDITARDLSGATVVVELKSGAAGQRAVAQVLSYMGDVVIEEPDVSIRGILVAESFDRKAVAAARMAPALSLKVYSVRFNFADA
jgi:hypothetical protein